MARQVSISDTLSTYPKSIDNTNSVYPGTFYNNNVLENCFTDATSSTRAAFYTTTGANAETKVYLNFDDCANIPSGATITSVSCSVKCGTQGTNYFSTRTVQMCAGTTVKGSSTTMSGSNSSPSTHTLSVGSWTASEIRNAKLYFHVVRGTSNTTTEATFSIFGATLTVEYSVNGYMYTIVATSTVSGVTATPSTQEIFQGESGTVRIDANSLDDLAITDNDSDISNSLVRHNIETGGTISKTAESYTTSGSATNSTYFSYPVGYTAENPHTYSSNIYASSNGSTAYAIYSFDFSDIPSNATITSVEVKCCGKRENSSTDSTHKAAIGLYANTTLKSTEQEFTSTSQQTITISNPGTWTRAELQSAKLRFTVAYYGGQLYGITWNVTYTVPSSGSDYYWTYTISNIAIDHVVLIEEAGAYIPPEEDPQYTYHSLTISSINATTDPPTGTTRIIEGTNQTITIYPTDPQLTLALDNGVDVTNQLVGSLPSNTYTVTGTVSGASYGFTMNNQTGYYTSNNDGQSNSAAVARVNFSLDTACLVTIKYINYAEATYDYGIFGQIDSSLGTTYTVDSGAYHVCSASSDNTSSVQTLTYQVPAGNHFIDIKYRKDQATDSNNDDLRWKIESIESTEGGGSYTYTLTNVTQKHSLIFVFGDVNYYFITSSSDNCRLYPDGQVVKLEGDSYRLIIVPDNPNATVTLSDNNVDRTSQLEYEEGEDKSGNKVVNYKYSLSNINATHTLVITCVADRIWVKISDKWTEFSQAWRKVNGSWVQIEASTAFSSGINYVKGN